MSKELENKAYQEQSNLDNIYNIFLQILLRQLKEETNE